MTPGEASISDEVRGETRRPSLVPLFIRQAALICIALFAANCSSVSPEQRLRATIGNGIEAAEEKDHAGLAGFVSDDYEDDRGRGRRELLGLVRGYLSQMGPLHIFSVEKSLVISSPGRAEVTLLVAVASVPIESIADLRRSTADLGRVELVFADEGGDWKLVDARWRQADLTDFL